MKFDSHILYAALLTVFIASCSKTKFEQVANCQNSGIVCTKSCEGENCFENFDQSYTSERGKVDLLFVVDNSGSMSEQQREIANKFPSLFTKIRDLDFRIAITTTDVEASRSSYTAARLNQPRSQYIANGYFQDGRLLSFQRIDQASGQVLNAGKFISNTTPQGEEFFKNTIQREETRLCDQNSFKGEFCPASDERAVFAVNRVLDRNEGFIRGDAHLALVIVSDEDERSRTKLVNGNIVPDNSQSLPMFNSFEPYDNPSNLQWRIKSSNSGKTFNAHSIVVRPGDSNCLAQQTNNLTAGQYGFVYSQLSQLSNGRVGNICATDYTSELGEIGTSIVQQVKSVRLACRPFNDKVEITFDRNVNTQVTTDLDNLTVTFDPNLPPGVTARVRYKCALK